MKSESEMTQTDTIWMSDIEHLSQLHTMWAPFIELGCIYLDEPLPEGWKTDNRNSMFKQAPYIDFRHIIEKATAKPSFIPDYLGLFQPDVSGWIVEFCGQQRTMKQILELLSFLSPLLDTQCLNWVVEDPDHLEVRLTHLLWKDGENALSLATQIAVVMSCVNKLYWLNTPPRDVVITIPTGDAQDMARSAVAKYLDRQRWPAHIERGEKRYASVKVPKYDRDGNVLKLAAPLRGAATPGGRSSGLYKEIQNALWSNPVLVEACTDRWMVNNIRDMSLDKYCEWAVIAKATANRKLKEHGLLWGEMKLETRYRWHYAMVAAGHTELEVAKILGCTVSEQHRWLKKNSETMRQIRERRRVAASTG